MDKCLPEAWQADNPLCCQCFGAHSESEKIIFQFMFLDHSPNLNNHALLEQLPNFYLESPLQKRSIFVWILMIGMGTDDIINSCVTLTFPEDWTVRSNFFADPFFITFEIIVTAKCLTINPRTT